MGHLQTSPRLRNAPQCPIRLAPDDYLDHLSNDCSRSQNYFARQPLCAPFESCFAFQFASD
jgi:hypothetical protein